MGTKKINRVTIDKSIIEGLRFADDLKNFNALKKNPKVKKLASKVIGEFADITSEQDFMKSGLKVTKELSPKYHDLFTRAENYLGFEENQIIPFIYPDFRANAACIHEKDDTYLIYLTSSLIEKMNEKEILFVIGHELGHAFYRHHELPVRGIMDAYDPPKASDALELLKWSRMAEISADRTGLLCCRDLEAALGAMIVLSSGLPSSYLNVDSDAYGKHAEELIPSLVSSQTLDDLYSTHPFNPLRVMSLNLFWESKELNDLLDMGLNNRDLSEISLEIRKIFSLMDGDDGEKEVISKKKPTKNVKPEASNTSDFILDLEEECLFWGCVLVSSITDPMSEPEIESILSINKNEEIVVELNRLKLSKNPESVAKTKFQKSLKDIENLPQQNRCSMLQKLIIVARADGVIDEKEKELLQSMCLDLKIPKNFYEKIINYL